MLASITGFLGTGKTLFMVERAYLANLDERDVFANFHIDLPNAHLIRPDDLEDIRNGVLLLDEGYLWMDSRLSGSKMNRSVSYEIFKARKKKLDIWITTQLHSAIDKRFRLLEDMHVEALGLNRNQVYEYQYFDYAITNVGLGKLLNWKIPLARAQEYYYPIYDTNEFPSENMEEEEDINDVIGEYAEEILTTYDHKKVTKGLVKDWILEKGEPMNMGDLVYQRIKRLSLV